MTRASEVVEGFWVGNSCDMPSRSDDGVGAEIDFDLCVGCTEGIEMPSTATLNNRYRALAELDKRRSRIMEEEKQKPSWSASPATVALRNLLSPSPSASALPELPAKRGASPTEEHSRQRRIKTEDDFVELMCSGSGRPFKGPQRNLNVLADKFVELIYFLRKIIEGRDKTGVKRKVLVHCADGYTESSILVLGYIMSSLSISLPEAYLHLQNTAQRSFFLYPNDKPFLKKIDARLAADRKAKALKLVNQANSNPVSSSSSMSNLSRWKSWTLGLNKGESNTPVNGGQRLVLEAARELLAQEERGGSDEYLKAQIWFEDKRFDGFPSRILPFLYLGNL
jgi:dual specificity MAP kinase phosphatase